MRFCHSGRGGTHVGQYILTLLIILAAPASVSAQIIDDFETGAFLVGGTSYDTSFQSPLPITHCLSQSRLEEMFINGTESGAQLSLVSPDNEVAMVWGNDGGRIEFGYDTSPTDLSFGGLYDALRVRLTVAVAAGRVEIELTDASAGTVMADQAITGPGDYVFPFADFVGVDPLDVEYIKLSLDIPDFGDYHVSDFRAVDTGVSAAGVDVLQGLVTGPPYATEALQFQISTDEMGADHPQEVLDLIAAAVTNAGAPPATEFMAVDSGGGMGLPGAQAQCMVEDMGPDPTGHRFFDLLFDANGVPPQTVVLKGLPAVQKPPGAMNMASFGLNFTTYVDDDVAGEARRVDHWLTFDTPVGSMTYFSNVQVMLGDPETHPNAFHLMFDVGTNGMVAARRAGPLFEMLLGAEVLNYGSTTGTPSWTGSNDLALWARPAVMDTTTRLWLSRSLTSDVRLGLFNVAGRAVQTLRVPAGQEFTVWDGRDRHGNLVASGLYLIRALDVANSGTAKVVKVR